MVGGALERRVWARTSRGICFPNLYVLLVASPGVGKFMIEEVRGLWTEAREAEGNLRAFHVNPDSMTKASLVDTLAKSKRIKLQAEGPALVYHSLLVTAEEFSVLLPNYDMEYIGTLNSIFNNKGLHEESRRTGTVKELRIENPQLNILGGVQPSFLASNFPEEMWMTGLARRLLMIYSAEAPYRELTMYQTEHDRPKAQISARLSQLSGLMGEMKWRKEAFEKLARWDAKGGGSSGGPPIPQHSKLSHYVRTRTEFAIKLSIISAISRSQLLIIEEIDVTRALEWLFEAELFMPDIFREMLGKSDTQVIEELHYFLMQLWLKDKQKPLHASHIYKFLSQRVPSEKIERLIQVAERANVIARIGGTEDLWIPRPKNTHGTE